MNAGSDFNHRVTRTPRAGHRTVVGAAPGTERKGTQARCARAGDVRDEGGVVHDECEGARLVEEVRCM